MLRHEREMSGEKEAEVLSDREGKENMDAVPRQGITLGTGMEKMGSKLRKRKGGLIMRERVVCWVTVRVSG